MHKGCGESYELSAVEEVEQQKGSGAWQFWCMVALLELVHGSTAGTGAWQPPPPPFPSAAPRTTSLQTHPTKPQTASKCISN